MKSDDFEWLIEKYFREAVVKEWDVQVGPGGIEDKINDLCPSRIWEGSYESLGAEKTEIYGEDGSVHLYICYTGTSENNRKKFAELCRFGFQSVDPVTALKTLRDIDNSRYEGEFLRNKYVGTVWAGKDGVKRSLEYGRFNKGNILRIDAGEVVVAPMYVLMGLDKDHEVMKLLK